MNAVLDEEQEELERNIKLAAIDDAEGDGEPGPTAMQIANDESSFVLHAEAVEFLGKEQHSALSLMLRQQKSIGTASSEHFTLVMQRKHESTHHFACIFP
jgi:hypothetical protein